MVMGFGDWRVIRPDAETVWEHEEVRSRLSWYYSVMVDEKPAKFLIVKSIDAGEDPRKLDMEGLWSLHDSLQRFFNNFYERIRRGKYGWEELRELGKPKWSFLDVKITIARNIIKSCHFCERRCRVNRFEKPGFCGVDYKTYVHSWFHHLGEEAPLVPSGTIFYGGCNFRCVYCQNYDISQEDPRGGEVVDAFKLALIQEKLRRTGARNINHVGGDPTPNIHTILESLKYLDVNVPQLWNSNMYLSIEAMKLIVDVIDIWLPDFKYGNNDCALRLSNAPNYVEIVLRNLKYAAKHGDMIIRHLVLPNHIDCCTKRVLEAIAKELPKDKVLVNIMDQYYPTYLVVRYPQKWPEITRRLKYREIKEAYEYAKKLGICFEPVS